ncbi:MAG: 2OG-Fe(II) oxygenase family protein [Amphiplicatus sp.]
MGAVGLSPTGNALPQCDFNAPENHVLLGAESRHPSLDPPALRFANLRAMSRPSPLRLNQKLEFAPWRERVVARGRAQIPDILEADAAKRILTRLEMAPRWNLATQCGDRHLDLDAKGMEARPTKDRAQFLALVHDQARDGFGYLFNNIPIYDIYHRRKGKDHPLNEVFELLNSAPMLEFARAITGCEDIGFADAQATRYLAGHFLTEHDDNVAGKNRRAAYVLSLSPKWRPDWGGLTLFFDEQGRVEEVFTPKFNTLSIFTVPQRHAVSAVAPFAGAPRYSITGWFRAGEDPLLRRE